MTGLPGPACTPPPTIPYSPTISSLVRCQHPWCCRPTFPVTSGSCDPPHCCRPTSVPTCQGVTKSHFHPPHPTPPHGLLKRLAALACPGSRPPKQAETSSSRAGAQHFSPGMEGIRSVNRAHHHTPLAQSQTLPPTLNRSDLLPPPATLPGNNAGKRCHLFSPPLPQSVPGDWMCGPEGEAVLIPFGEAGWLEKAGRQGLTRESSSLSCIPPGSLRQCVPAPPPHTYPHKNPVGWTRPERAWWGGSTAQKGIHTPSSLFQSLQAYVHFPSHERRPQSTDWDLLLSRPAQACAVSLFTPAVAWLTHRRQ